MKTLENSTTEPGTKTPAKKVVLFSFLSLISSFLVACFPLVYFTNRNLEWINTHDFFQALGGVALHWLIVIIINLLILKDFHLASLTTIFIILPLSLFKSGFAYISRVVPAFQYWHVLMLVFTFYILLIFIIKKYVKPEVSKKLNIIAGAVFLMLILINASPFISQQGGEKRKADQKNNALGQALNAISPVGDKLPNIYLFIFDEYAGYDGLLRYTGFDNQKFYDDLSNLGFKTSKHSLSYSTSSNTEITNLLNLSTGAMKYTEQEKNNAMKDPFLLKLLKEVGYDFNLINDQSFISTPKTYFKHQFVPQGYFQQDENLLSLLIEKSVYYPIRTTTSNPRMLEVNEMFAYGAEASTIQQSGLFTFGYLMFPHQPWVVDENGKLLDEKDRDNFENTDIYLGQLKYSNKMILKLVLEIIENDPESCILLLSDHGYRHPSRLKKYRDISMEDPALEYLYMRNTLNAVYIKGEAIDFEDYSGINTLRLVLDRLFSLGLGMIEEPGK